MDNTNISFLAKPSLCHKVYKKCTNLYIFSWPYIAEEFPRLSHYVFDKANDLLYSPKPIFMYHKMEVVYQYIKAPFYNLTK